MDTTITFRGAPSFRTGGYGSESPVPVLEIAELEPNREVFCGSGSKIVGFVSELTIFRRFFKVFHGSKLPVFDSFLWFRLDFTIFRRFFADPAQF